MKNSRKIGGWILVLAGFILIGIGAFFPFTFIYGIPLLIIGIIILYNKNEDKIEQIDYSKMKGGKSGK